MTHNWTPVVLERIDNLNFFVNLAKMTETEGLEDTALHEAVRYADVDDVKGALQNGCDPNQIGLYQWTPLHEAANNGDLSIVKLLLNIKVYICSLKIRDWSQ